MSRTMLLAPRNVGCDCCNGLDRARPAAKARMRRTVKRVERRDALREALAELDD